MVLVSKKCTKCKESKPKASFHKGKTNPWCRECSKAYSKLHYDENKLAILARQAELKKTSKYKEARRKRSKEAYRASPQKRVRQSAHTALTDLLSGKRKSSWVLKHLGCTVTEWKRHLESQFKPGMNWDNRGVGKEKWCLDHVVPLSSADLQNKDELDRVLNYKNTQPLFQQENSSKGARILPEEEARSFEYKTNLAVEKATFEAEVKAENDIRNVMPDVIIALADKEELFIVEYLEKIDFKNNGFQQAEKKKGKK
ncbi:MAG: hypothetical protein DRQ49_19660 [Gammaproteobacteria bacterium]|nr:MAG: hypothetical protein DRQ49_19660 [Gammaproteobacteria bacterium]